MSFQLTADLLVLLHFAFILFVVLGGLLVLKRPWVAMLHLPCVVWGLLIEWHGWICPLTPLELQFRELAGAAGYAGGFIDHYLMPLIYPSGLTHSIGISLAVGLLGFNLLVYGYLIFSRSTNQQG